MVEEAVALACLEVVLEVSAEQVGCYRPEVVAAAYFEAVADCLVAGTASAEDSFQLELVDWLAADWQEAGARA